MTAQDAEDAELVIYGGKGETEEVVSSAGKAAWSLRPSVGVIERFLEC